MLHKLALTVIAVASVAAVAGTDGSAGDAGRAAFVDPLDQPAPPAVKPPGGALLAIATAGRRLVAVGRRGMIVLTDDGGKSWRQAKVPASSDLTSVHFVDASLGWAAGHDGIILHSADGGESWVKQLDGRQAAAGALAHYMRRVQAGEATLAPMVETAQRLVQDGPDKPFLDIRFTDSRHGYAVGAFNYAFATDDGGRTWHPIFERIQNPEGLHLRALATDGTDVYLAGERGLLLKLDPTTQRFADMGKPYEGTYFGLAVLGPGHLLAYGLLGSAVESEDGGKTWSKRETGLRSSITGGNVLSGGRVVLVSQDGKAVLREASGAFTRVPTVCARPYFGVQATRNDELLLIGMSGACLQPISKPN